MDNVKDAFSGGLNNIVGGLSDFKNKVSRLFDTVINFIKDILSNIINGFKNVVDGILNLPNVFETLLKKLFVPTYSPLEECKNKIYSKFTFITQMVTLSAYLFNDFDSNATPPTFTITYKGTTSTIIDWSVVEPYRAYYQSIIIAVSWVFFVLWFFKFAPRFIKGGG